MKIAGPFFLVLVDSTSKKEFTDLSQTAAFLPGDLQQSALDFTRHSEPNAFVLRCHDFARILAPPTIPRKSLSPLT